MTRRTHTSTDRICAQRRYRIWPRSGPSVDLDQYRGRFKLLFVEGVGS